MAGARAPRARTPSLIENGFVFNTNCFHQELPFLWEKDGKLLVELPRQPFGDGTLFGHRHVEYGNPYHVV